jgi:hypothetical protein
MGQNDAHRRALLALDLQSPAVLFDNLARDGEAMAALASHGLASAW